MARISAGTFRVAIGFRGKCRVSASGPLNQLFWLLTMQPMGQIEGLPMGHRPLAHEPDARLNWITAAVPLPQRGASNC